MVVWDEKRSLRLASCWSVDVRNGAAGRRVYGFSSTFSTLERAPRELVRERSSSALVEHENRGRRGSAVLTEVAALRDALSVHERQARLERARLERSDHVPVAGSDEAHPLALAVDDQARGDGLHSACREPRHHLLPEDGRDLVAVQAVEDAARLLRVDEPVVDGARLLERTQDRVLGDLMEDHPLDRDLRLQHLDQVPRDRLALAILVGREEELVGVGEPLLQVCDDLLLVGVDDVVRLEAVRDVDAERTETLSLRFRHVSCAIGKIADVPDARADGVATPEVALDRSRFRRRLHDDETLAHRRKRLAPPSTVTVARYCSAWPRHLVRAGSTSSSAG